MLSGAEEEVGDVEEAGDIAEVTGAEEAGATEALSVEALSVEAGATEDGGGAGAGGIGVGVGAVRGFMAVGTAAAMAAHGVIGGATAGAVFHTDIVGRS